MHDTNWFRNYNINDDKCWETEVTSKDPRAGLSPLKSHLWAEHLIPEIQLCLQCSLASPDLFWVSEVGAVVVTTGAFIYFVSN